MKCAACGTNTTHDPWSSSCAEELQRQRDELMHLVRFLEWSGYVWRQREDGPGQYLIAGCPVCLVPKDSGAHGAGCRLYELLVPKSHTVPVRDSGDA